MNALAPARLTLGPLLYHWSAQQRRDFYFRIADEAPVDTVYLGEVVCSKREPTFAPFMEAAIARLRAAGKEVVVSTLALVTTRSEVETIAGLVASGLMVEANDVACVRAAGAACHRIHQHVREGARDFRRPRSGDRAAN
jgi:collagenase-like PrtC family protease